MIPGIVYGVGSLQHDDGGEADINFAISDFQINLGDDS
jgi:hypothetical protein